MITYILQRSPWCNTQIKQRKQDRRFWKFYHAVIHVILFKFGGTFIIPSMRCGTSPVFLGAVVSRPVTLRTHVRKSEKEMTVISKIELIKFSRHFGSSVLCFPPIQFIRFLSFISFVASEKSTSNYISPKKDYCGSNTYFLLDSISKLTHCSFFLLTSSFAKFCEEIVNPQSSFVLENRISSLISTCVVSTKTGFTE